jgi:O-antigen/teichoic acid export membrane protein
VGAAFAYSGANFLLAFYLQRTTGLAAFGLFALVQVYVQFGMSVSNGLFCSPIILAIQSETGRRRQQVIASFARVSLLASLVGAAALYAAVLALTADPGVGLLAAIYGLGSWTRWFFRSVELANGHVLRPASADVLYSVIVCLGVAGMMFLKIDTLHAAFAVQTAGCIAAFAAMAGSAFAAFRGAFRAPAAPFNESFRKHGRWAVLGVATTEATANAHPYIIGAILGPAAFAPIAAVTLFYRPLTIVAQALTQYERPRMAKALAQGDAAAVQQDVRQFTVASTLAWAGNLALVLMLAFWLTGLIGNADYASGDIQIAAILLGAIYLARSLRGAESAALQAAGLFRPLAWITVVTAPLSLLVVGVIVAIVPGAVVWSLLGILAGETLTCVLIRRTWHAHLNSRTPLAQEGPQCAS